MSTLQIPRRIPANKMSYDNSVPMLGYVGAKKDELAQGFRESLENELEFLNLVDEQNIDLASQCEKLIRSFLNETWKVWSGIKTACYAEEITANMKSDTKDIISFVEEALPYLPIDEETGFMCNYVYQASRADQTSGSDGNNVCVNCPRYVSRQFYLCPVDMSEMEPLAMHWFRIKFKPYRYLWLATIKIYQYVMKYYNTDMQYSAYNTILMLPAAIGKLYEMTNPVEELLDNLSEEKVKQLESPPVEHTEEEWSYFNRIWDEVYHDITKTNLEYVKTWRRALKRLNLRPFEDKDYFLSSKSSSYHIKGLTTKWGRGKHTKRRKQSSYFVSMAENDPIKDDPIVKVFDDAIQYHSYYNDEPNENLVGSWSHYTFVLNKGKRKLRGIRLECNSVQDRCQYLEDIEREWQDLIAYNARREQSIGYTLGIRATRTWYEFMSGSRTDIENWPSLYNTDFTDATDTVSQTVLYKYNLTFYGKEIADFWKYICSKTFTFKIPGKPGETLECTPQVGNPQGCKKSFTDFNGLHLYILAMVFKILSHLKLENPELFRHSINYQNIPIELAASALGDDDGIWSIKADPIINEDIFPFFDEKMGHAGAMYQVYCWLCKMCNWILNPDKASIVTPESKQAVWEFAKVTVVDGHTLTAPPFRMVGYMKGLDTKHPIVKPLAFALWRMKTKHDYAEIFMDKILQKYSDSEEMYSFLYKLIFGGFLPSLKDYKKDDIVTDLEHALIYLALIRVEIKVGLVSQILSEYECDITNDYSLDNLLWNEFDENLYNKIQHNEHKFNMLLDRHLVLTDLAKTIKGLDSVDDKLLESFCAVTAIRHGYDRSLDVTLDLILSAQNMIKLMDDNILSPSDLIDTMNGIEQSKLDELQNFTANLITQGTDKRPSVESTIGLEAWNEFQDLNMRLASFDAEVSEEAHPDITADLSP